MPELKVGDAAPDFSLPGDNNSTISLSGYKGRKLVLYFYPKDDTPGCTTESCGFRDSIQDFNKADIDVVGVSKDGVESHNKFKKKYGLNFPLISDENGELCEKFGVWKEKSMYGRKFMGIERSTFLIDEKGRIASIWRNVKVDGHVDEVGETARKIGAA